MIVSNTEAVTELSSKRRDCQELLSLTCLVPLHLLPDIFLPWLIGLCELSKNTLIAEAQRVKEGK